MRFKYLVLLALCVTLKAEAIGYVLGKVSAVRVDKDGRGMVMFDRNLSSSPASCVSSSYANALAFNSNTAAGRAILAMALSAKMSGGTVSAYGTGACTIYNGSYVEDMDYGIVS